MSVLKNLTTLKKGVKKLVGRDFDPQKDIEPQTLRLGSTYGGFEILPHLLQVRQGPCLIYSFGIGEDISFDLELLQHINDAELHAFDPTPKSLQWLKTQNLPDQMSVHAFGLAHFNGQLTLYPPENPDHVSLRTAPNSQTPIKLPVQTLGTIMKSLQHQKIDLLKMDIEGSEYGVIEELSSSNLRPVQLLIEFHHRFPGVGVQKTKAALRLLKSMGYALFAISDTLEEMSFVHSSAQPTPTEPTH